MERTCGNCKHVFCGGVMNHPIAACVITDNVVPHESMGDGKFTFWRIPLGCPRTDGEVLKSEKQAPKKYWTTKNVKDLPR